MKTKRIVAETMPLALKKVRQELGDNAIIVNTKTVKKGGIFGLFAKQKFEVTAYSNDRDEATPNATIPLESKEQLVKQMVANKKREAWPAEEEKQPSILNKSPQKLYHYYAQSSTETEKPAVDPLETNKTAQVPSANADKDETVLMELQNMRKMMMSYMMNNQQEDKLPEKISKYMKRLKQHGVMEEVLQHLLNNLYNKYPSFDELDEATIKNELLNFIVEMIAQRVPTSLTIPEDTRMIHVIGPTGVGKTTSIAKLATEQVLRQKRRVAMISADVYRIAAVEQLKTYAGILNVPIEVVRSADEVTAALEKLKNYDLIYMDTTGRNYKERKHRDSIAEYLNQPVKSDHYLVLSLTSKFEDMTVLLDEFLESPVQKLILTKFDETSSYGSILNIAFKYRYELAYVTNGQSVPEDITGMDAGVVASCLLGEN